MSWNARIQKPAFSLLSRRHEACVDGQPSTPGIPLEAEVDTGPRLYPQEPLPASTRKEARRHIFNHKKLLSDYKGLRRREQNAKAGYILYDPAEVLAQASYTEQYAKKKLAAAHGNVSPRRTPRKHDCSPKRSIAKKRTVDTRSPASLDASLMSPDVPLTPTVTESLIDRLPTMQVDAGKLNVGLVSTPHHFEWEEAVAEELVATIPAPTRAAAATRPPASPAPTKSTAVIADRSQAGRRVSSIDPGARLMLERVLEVVVTRSARDAVVDQELKRVRERAREAEVTTASNRTIQQYEELLRLADTNKQKLQDLFREREEDFVCQIQEKESAHANLEHELILLREANKSLRTQNRVLTKDAQRERQEREQFRREAARLEGSIAELSSAKRESDVSREHALDQLAFTKSQLSREMKSAQTIPDSVRQIIEELSLERDELVDANTELHAEVQAAHLALETAVAAHEQFSAKVETELSQTSFRYEEELSELKSVASDLRQREHRARLAVNATPDVQLSEENSALRAQIDAFRADTGPQLKLVAAEQEMERLTDRASYLEAENNRLRCAIAEAHAAEGGSQSQHAVAAAKMESVEARAALALQKQEAAEAARERAQHEILKLQNDLSAAHDEIASLKQSSLNHAASEGKKEPIVKVIHDPHASDLIRNLAVQKELQRQQRSRHSMELGELNDTISSLTTENRELTAQLSERSGRLIDIQTDLEREVQRAAGRDRALAQTKADLAQVTRESRAELEVMRVALENANSRILSMGAERLDLIAQNTAAHVSPARPTRVSQLPEREDAERRVIAKLKDDNESLQRENTLLSESLSAAESELRLMTQTMSQLSSMADSAVADDLRASAEVSRDSNRSK